MGEISKILGDVEFPDFYKAEYLFPTDDVGDIAQAVRTALKREGTLDIIKPGSRVCLTGSSREINGMATILKTLIEELKRVGAEPFIVPGMGSHGGATAEGQAAILEHYGITEDTMGVPLYADMTTVDIGKTEDGFTVRIDKNAYEADHIIPIGRIKPHPEFKGKYESGIMKMLAIGLGKQHGAEVCHKLGMPAMPENIRKFATLMIEKCNVAFGIGIIENGVHGTYSVTAIPAKLIPEEEPILLDKAKEILPVIPFKKADVLVVERIGKDISGTGMDSNVIGRSISLGQSRPFFERITTFHLTEVSAGNFNGSGLCDCIPRHLFDQFDFEITYPNAITASETHSTMIPAILDNDELCFRLCLRTCTQAEDCGMRVVWIKDTGSVKNMYISKALYEEAKTLECMKVYDDIYRVSFDKNGNYDKFIKV